MSEALARLLPEGMHWGRPAGLLALLLPLAVLLASLRPALPEPRHTGAIALWRNVRSAGSGGRTRLVVPLARWLWIVALLLGALALAGPERRPPAPAFSLAVVVDGSASMGLAHPDGGTRGEAALRGLERWLESQEPVALEGFDGQALGDLGEVARGTGAAVADWAPYDQLGVVWVTDDGAGLEPVFAGLFASGGGAVPGPVAARGAARWWWDGQGLEWREDAGQGGELVVVGKVPPGILDLARLWAEERDWSVSESSLAREPAGAGLCLIAHPGLPGREREVGRDGWTARVRPSTGAPVVPAGAQIWLPGLVWTSPGRVDLSIASIEGEGAEAGAFVSSWADLLDTGVRGAADVVALDERGDAGEPRFVAPRLMRRVARGDGRDGAGGLAAWLAAAAVVLGVAALALSGFARGL